MSTYIKYKPAFVQFWAFVFSQNCSHNWAIAWEVPGLCLLVSVSSNCPLHLCTWKHLRWWLACRHALVCSFCALNPDFHHQRIGLSADRGQIAIFCPCLLDPLKGNVTEIEGVSFALSFTDMHHPKKKKASHFNLFELGRILTGSKSQCQIMILLKVGCQRHCWGLFYSLRALNQMDSVRQTDIIQNCFWNSRLEEA